MATKTLEKVQGKTKVNDLVRQAHERFALAIEAMFSGNTALLGEVWSQDSDVSMFDPFGGRLIGWDQISSMFQQCGQAIKSGRISSQDVRVNAAGDDIAYVTSYESGELITQAGQTIKFGLRASSIYRNENGQWKLVHHHVDESPALQSGLKK